MAPYEVAIMYTYLVLPFKHDRCFFIFVNGISLLIIGLNFAPKSSTFIMVDRTLSEKSYIP